MADEEKKETGVVGLIGEIVKKPLEMAGDVIEGVTGIMGVGEKKKAEGEEEETKEEQK